MTELKISQLTVTLGNGVRKTQVLSSVDLTVHDGEFLALSGVSGSGKTTLLRAIAGLLPADSGSIMLNKQDITQLSDTELMSLRREKIGFIHQDNLLLEELTALENVTLTLTAAGWSTHEAVKEARACLAQVGLESKIDNFPNELSGGQCQRVGIARAISGGRELLIADEPSASLDSDNVHSIFTLFRELSNSGKTIIVASHDERIYSYADTHKHLEDGRFQENLT